MGQIPCMPRLCSNQINTSTFPHAFDLLMNPRRGEGGGGILTSVVVTGEENLIPYERGDGKFEWVPSKLW